MPARKLTEPKCIETRIHRGGGGKVAIMDYGRVGSDYSVNITRAYEIPADWTEDQVTEFEEAKLAEFKLRLDPVLDAEFEERWNQKVWENQ